MSTHRVWLVQVMQYHVLIGFQGGGGGGLCGLSGGMAEKIVFRSMTLLPVVLVKEINAATIPAFPAKVGSVKL